MKIRTDFVTNSSSSSFVINRKELMTKDAAFLEIRKYYAELYEKIDKIKEMIESGDTTLRLETDEFGKYNFTSDGRSWWDMRDEDEKFLDSLGLSKYDRVEVLKDWLNCNSYAEYEAYWLEKLQGGETAPFTIVDFSERTVRWLHWSKGEEEVADYGTDSYILDWYFPYLEECMESASCDSCEYRECCEEEECMEDMLKAKKKAFTDDNACMVLLGSNICVCSESSYMPEYVTDKLAGCCHYWCGHMG